MISDTTIGCNEETLGIEDESLDGIKYMKAQISKLSAENDKYKQDIHELHRKLEVSRTMEAELGEFNKTLEQALDKQKVQASRRIHEIEEKHLLRDKELRDKLSDMELELAKKAEENRSLREIVKAQDEKLLALNRSQISASIEDNSELMKCQIEELTELLSQEENVRKKHEETLRVMEKELDELGEILAATKQQLTEKNKAVESMREELFECRMELESLKSAPVTDKPKGNSLFAEVEDRRKMTLEQMNAMRASYLEAKRSFQAKEAEIRSLKAEKALLLRKWEDDTIEKIQQDADLVEKYKLRVSELETRLKEEQKKNKQNTKDRKIPENKFTFLQSLVDAKTKEIEELTTKLENDSIKVLLDEESKHKMGKQLRYWRYRAMSSEAELVSIKDRLESNSSSSHAEILKTIKQRLSETKNEPEETLKNESIFKESTSANETVVTLDTLMTIPKPIVKTKCVNLSNLNNIDETMEGSKLLNDETNVSMEETAVINNIVPIKATAVRNNVSMEETAVINNIMPINQIAVRDDVSMEETAMVNNIIHVKDTLTVNDVSMEETAVISNIMPIREMTVSDNVSMEETTMINNIMHVKDNEITNDVFMEETAVVNNIPTFMVKNEQISEQDYQRFDDSMDIEDKTNTILGRKILFPMKNDDKENHLHPSVRTREPTLKSVLSKPKDDATTILLSKDMKEREKKTLRFTSDTIDPQKQTLKKHSSTNPKYPIVFISSNKSKK